MEKTVKKLLVITGANKGIGYSIIDSLLRQKNTDYTILLCSRTTKNGDEAVSKLKEKHGDLVNNVKVAELDISDEKSTQNFVELIKKSYDSKITCLVNNAGVAVKGDDYNTEVFDYTLGVNFYSTVKFTKLILSNNLIQDSGKIVFIGSSMGRLFRIKNDEIREKFKSKDLDEKTIFDLASQFRASLEKKSTVEDGWPDSIYAMSKICINKYAYVLGHTKEILDKGIQVYSCCPGWVKTDMGGPNAYRTLEEGSVTPVFLVNLKYEVNETLQGQFFYDEKVSEL